MLIVESCCTGMSQAEPDGDDSDNWKWSEDSPGTSSTVNNTVANEPELFPEASQASSAVTEPESQLMHQSSFAGSISGGTAGGGDDEDDDSDSDGFVEAKPGRSRSKRKIKVKTRISVVCLAWHNDDSGIFPSPSTPIVSSGAIYLGKD